MFVLLLAACTPAASDSAEKSVDPEAACTDLCTASGFDAGTAVDEGHELNCTCTGGDGTAAVADADCADMCTGLDWASSATFSATGGAVDSCQCAE